MERSIIFKCVTGSHLYGTNVETSDMDYIGVFIPSTEELLGLQNPPAEWSMSEKVSDGPRNTKGDVDCKFYSVRSFLNLAAQGQPAQLEMLFAPPELVLTTTPEWDYIQQQRHLLLSRRGIAPFLGFATSQANKAVLKGENLRILRSLAEVIDGMDAPNRKKALSEHFVNLDLSLVEYGDEGEEPTEQGTAELFGQRVRVYRNAHGYMMLDIAGREYDVNKPVKAFRSQVDTLINRYGTRVQQAAEEYYDYKSLLHAVRQLGEAEEFLKTGKITLPRPPDELELLMKIRRKEWPESPDFDLFDYLEQRVSAIKEIETSSPLPKNPDRGKLNQLCVDLHRDFILMDG